MGKLLISGDGQGNSALATVWFVSFIMGAVGCAIAIFLANEFGYTQTMFGGRVRNDGYYIWFASAIIIAVGVVIDAAVRHSRITSTNVKVYEHGVKGKSLLTIYQITAFQLSYDQITLTEVLSENCVIIHTVGTRHKCYTKNANEISTAIMRQKEQQPTDVKENADAGKNSYSPTDNTGTTEQPDPLVRRAFLELDDGEWDKADELFEQALNDDPENAKAYIGRLCAELHLSSEESLLDYEQPIRDNKNFKRALKFADKNYRAALERYALTPEDKKQLEERKRQVMSVIEYAESDHNSVPDWRKLASELTGLAKVDREVEEVLRKMSVRVVDDNKMMECALCGAKQTSDQVNCVQCGIKFSSISRRKYSTQLQR